MVPGLTSKVAGANCRAAIRAKPRRSSASKRSCREVCKDWAIPAAAGSKLRSPAGQLSSVAARKSPRQFCRHVTRVGLQPRFHSGDVFRRS